MRQLKRSWEVTKSAVRSVIDPVYQRWLRR